MPTKGTQATPIRFDKSDLETIDRIRDFYGLPSRAAAVRHAIRKAARGLKREPEKNPKKSGKAP